MLLDTKINYIAPRVEVHYYPTMDLSELPKITNAEDAYRCFLSDWNIGRINMQEEFKVLFLNQDARVIGVDTISAGGVTGTIVDARLIFMKALTLLATGIICAHNHPSGSLRPSNADITLTRKLMDAGKLLNIEVKDHLIVSESGYCSFMEEGFIVNAG